MYEYKECSDEMSIRVHDSQKQKACQLKRGTASEGKLGDMERIFGGRERGSGSEKGKS